MGQAGAGHAGHLQVVTEQVATEYEPQVPLIVAGAAISERACRETDRLGAGQTNLFATSIHPSSRTSGTDELCIFKDSEPFHMDWVALQAAKRHQGIANRCVAAT